MANFFLQLVKTKIALFVVYSIKRRGIEYYQIFYHKIRIIESFVLFLFFFSPALLAQNNDTVSFVKDSGSNSILFLNKVSDTKSLAKTNTLDQLLIMPLGNSITYDYRASDTRVIADKIGYRFPLYNLLNNLGINYKFIGSEHAGSNYLPTGYDDNAGFPGIKDNELTNLLITGRRVQPPDYNVQITPGPYLQSYTPDIILLHIGTNDNNISGGTSETDVQNILDEVDRVENLLNKEIPVIVARIIDRVPNQSYVNELNNNVEAMVLDRVNNPTNPAYPDNLYMVDMEDSAKIDYTIDYMGTIGDGIPGDMSDYLHPNDKGYEKMAQVWYNALANIFPNPILVEKQPENINSIAGESAMVTFQVRSTKPINYQWKKNGVIIPSATDSIYITDQLTMEDDSSKIVCEIQSGYYAIASDTVMIFVTDSTLRIGNGLIAYYTFEQDRGDIIKNKVDKYPDLDLKINDTTAVNWVPYGLNINQNPQIYSMNPAKDIYGRVIQSNEITLESWIEPLNNSQTGPARIITISQDASNRNITLGQDADKFEIRLRTNETSENGNPSVYSTANSVINKLTHIAYTRKNDGEVSIYINGELNIRDTIPGDFSNWDSTYSLGVGNEFVDDRLWLGKYYLASIYDRALSSTEILHNFQMKFNGFNNLLERPVNLSSYIQNGTDVVLNWEYNSTDELGFIIERRLNKPDSLFKIVDSVASNVFSFIDSTQKYDSSYVYRMKAYNEDSNSDYSDEIIVNDIPVSVSDNILIASEFKLFQNYPNPFNPTTNFKFYLAKQSEVDLIIFNPLGEIVKILYDKEIKSAGIYSKVFNGNGLASGIYFYRLSAKPVDGSPIFIKINKAVLLK